ncbi:MAG: hypothetical protein JWQ04_1881 [Pedosphaera sp.]|nr:hypothetical protein [Pedosphaera sp.]
MAEPRDAMPGAAQIGAPMPERGKLRRWIWDLRTNSRFAFALQVSLRILTSGLNLFWSRLLQEAMGDALLSLFQACQSVFSLGGLGDFGMGGAVGIRTGQYLGAGKSNEQELKKFLASARTVFLALTVVCGGGMLMVSPWLPQWLSFPPVDSAGSLTSVFTVGALSVAGVMLFSYISNVNYACGNIAWPVLPDFILLQASLLCHWWLARQQQPLWIQFLPYLISATAKLGLMWWYVRTSHPQLSRLRPLGFDRGVMLTLFEGSFWVYLCCLGNAIYRNTDALVITAGFVPGTLVRYNYNYKFCDLMVMIVTTASVVILPKMTQWMASSDPKDQQRVRVEMNRLNQFQILLGCGAALSYLAFNDIFMKIWWFHTAHPIPPAALPLQIAFALNLAVTASGDTGLQLALRSGSQGLRMGGMLVATTGLLNVVLSLIAMKMNYLPGIALATVLAQAVAMLGSSFYICRHLKIAWLPWAFKGCILPLIGISFAGWLRTVWPLDSALHTVLLLGTYTAILAAAAWGLGLNVALIKEELLIVKQFIKR